MRAFLLRNTSSAVEVACVFLIAGGIAMISVAAGVIALGALGLGISMVRELR